jgi:hypothetical protein
VILEAENKVFGHDKADFLIFCQNVGSLSLLGDRDSNPKFLIQRLSFPFWPRHPKWGQSRITYTGIPSRVSHSHSSASALCVKCGEAHDGRHPAKRQAQRMLHRAALDKLFRTTLSCLRSAATRRVIGGRVGRWRAESRRRGLIPGYAHRVGMMLDFATWRFEWLDIGSKTTAGGSQ